MSRRKFILHYFGEEFDTDTGEGGQMDDNMRNPKTKQEAQKQAQKLLRVISETNEQYKSKDVVNVIIGNANALIKSHRTDKQTFFGIGVAYEDHYWMALLRQLLVAKYIRKDIWVLDTTGSNLLETLSLDYIDVNRTVSNDIQEIYHIFGIEAARNAIFQELTEVIEFDSTYINYHHLSMLCDRMCYKSKMISIFRHGINNDDIGPIAKASFEETPEMFLKAARHAELDPMRGVSANVMCGQQGYFGTSAFQVLADINALMEQEPVEDADEEDELGDNIIDNAFEGVSGQDDKCSINNLTIDNNTLNIKELDLGGADDDYDIEF